LPAIGQGVLSLETRKGDDETLGKLRFMNDEPTGDCMIAERKVLETLEGNCQVPLAGFCKLDGNNLHLRALIAKPDGSTIFRAEERARRDEAEELGARVANQLLQQGGGALLQKLSAMEER
ncbi:MAG: hydroxymethylbilane synthase, partial [SAR324 cluster bacterium]|nr:hydroxymethylbilane synthase [SAR324 cluster bacterium]